MAEKSRSPITTRRKVAGAAHDPRRRRRSSNSSQIVSILRDHEIELFLEDTDVPHPDTELPKARFPFPEGEIERIQLQSMLKEPLGRHFLKESILNYRAERQKSKAVKAAEHVAKHKPTSAFRRVSKGGMPAYAMDYDPDLMTESDMKWAGMSLDFLDAVFNVLQSKPSGTISLKEARDLQEKYNMDFDFGRIAHGRETSERGSKDGPSRVGGGFQEQSIDEERSSVRTSMALARSTIAEFLLARIASSGEGPKKNYLKSMRSFRTPKKKLDQEESSKRMDVPMDVQKSLADSSFGDSSKNSSSNVPLGGGSMSSFIAMTDENGQMMMKLEPDNSEEENVVTRMIIATVAANLEDLFLYFKTQKELVNQYLCLSYFTATELSELALRQIRTLGHGSFGEVHAVTIRNLGYLLAQKTFQKARLKQRNERSVFLAELKCLEVLTKKPSPFCLRLIATYETKTMYNIVVPCGIGGDLKHLLDEQVQLGRPRKLEVDQARFYACEISMAIGHLHKLGYLYRDLKPANVLLDGRGHCLLVDFGLAIYVGKTEGRTSGRCGTPGYMSPEVMEGKEYSVDIDWWAFGCMLFEFLEGLTPFDPKITGMTTRESGVMRMEQVIFPDTFPKVAQPLISNLLYRRVRDRCGCNGMDVKEILNSTFFTSGWSYQVDQFRSRYDDLPAAPYVPAKKKIHAPEQWDAEQAGGKFAIELKSTEPTDISFEPYLNKNEIQRDLVRRLTYEKRVHDGEERVMQEKDEAGDDDGESVDGASTAGSLGGPSPRNSAAPTPTAALHARRKSPRASVQDTVPEESVAGVDKRCVIM